jgi:serine/threonine protein phosphatase 1
MISFQEAPGSLPDGRRIYAIGDCHGMADRLFALHRAIAEDLARRPVAAPLLLHVGDYIDRGPDSAGIIERLAAGGPLPGVPTVNLLGNHEQTMIEALSGDRAAGTDWLHHGGRTALESWGIDPDSPRETWPDGVPAAHLDFVQGLALSHRDGGYLFVHAGIRPGVALEAQTKEDMLRIRTPFLTSEASFGVVVVHGHTPVPAPVIRHNRIGIDTGAAVFDGPLTCAVLEGRRVGFLVA